MATNDTKTKKTKKHGIKTEFVRSKPDMTAAEIIAAGLKLRNKIHLTPNHVYNIRSVDRKAAAELASGESTAKDGKPTGSKAQPVTKAPAAANGKSTAANGHKSAARNGKSAVTRSAGASSRSTSSGTRQARGSSTSDAEMEMRSLVLRIGLDRAVQIFSEIEAAAMSMTRGEKTASDSSARQSS